MIKTRRCVTLRRVLAAPTPYSSAAVTVLLLLLCLGAAAAVALWTFGMWVTLSPEQAGLLLAASAGLAMATLVLSRRRGLQPRVRLLAGVGALATLGAAVAFPIVLYLSAPGEVRHWSAGGSQDAAAEPRRLRVFQLNVFHDHPRFEDAERRIEDLEGLLDTLDADIVVLQESWSVAGRENLARRIARRHSLHAVYARANGSHRLLGFEEGLAVLSRYPLERAKVIELAPRKHLFDRRIALVVDVAVPARARATDPVRVVATHLANDAPEVTEAQARDLVRQLDIPAGGFSAYLLAGDLNAEAQSAALQHLEDAGWLATHQGDRDHLLIHKASARWRRLWSEWVDARRVANPWEGETSAVGWLSDHPAILAELELAGPPTASRWRGSWEGASQTRSRAPRARADTALDSAVTERDLERAIVRTADAIGAIDGVQSVLVVHDGALLAERYFRGATAERLSNMKSASKGVLSALVGIAISEGHLALEDPIANYLPEARALDDPRKAAITVRDLLTMRSGLESTSFAAYGSWGSSRNLVRAALERPLLSEPGTDYAYSTGNSHLLSAVLTAATGESTLDYARRRLFEPLGIESVAWDRDRQGIYLGGNNLAMRPRDMARFGLLYLDRGLWGDRQVVPWSWVDASTVSSNPGWSRSWGGSYGYHWWVRAAEERGAYNASGFGGQHIFISRAEDLVVVVSSTELSKGRDWRRELFEEIRTGIVEPIRARAERPVS